MDTMNDVQVSTFSDFASGKVFSEQQGVPLVLAEALWWSSATGLPITKYKRVAVSRLCMMVELEG